MEKVPFFGKAKIDRFRLSNGLRLMVVQNPLAPVFSYQTWYNVGSRDEEEGKSGLAHLFEHMMFKGTKKRKQGVYDRTLEQSGARDLNAFTGTDYTAYVQSLPREHLELVAELECDRMTGLYITKSQFESEREVVRNERKQRTENNPEGQMYEELQKMAFEVHPYGRPVIGYEKDLDAMNVDDCYAFYREHYSPNNAVICVIGDVKPERALHLIEKHYGKIPTCKSLPHVPAEEPEQKERRVVALNLPLQVEKTYAAYKIPNAMSQDQPALSLLSIILSTGRSSRLYRALTDKGHTIDISAGGGGGKDPGLYYISFTCQQGRRSEDCLALVEEEFAKILSEGLKESELERAKNKVQMETYQSLLSNSSIAHFIGSNEIVMGSMEAALEEIALMKKVSSSDVQRVVRTYFRPERQTVVIGRPQ